MVSALSYKFASREIVNRITKDNKSYVDKKQENLTLVVISFIKDANCLFGRQYGGSKRKF